MKASLLLKGNYYDNYFPFRKNLYRNPYKNLGRSLKKESHLEKDSQTEIEFSKTSDFSEEFYEYDINMPPKREYDIKIKLLTVEKGKLEIDESDWEYILLDDF